MKRCNTCSMESHKTFHLCIYKHKRNEKKFLRMNNDSTRTTLEDRIDYMTIMIHKLYRTSTYLTSTCKGLRHHLVESVEILTLLRGEHGNYQDLIEQLCAPPISDVDNTRE